MSRSAIVSFAVCISAAGSARAQQAYVTPVVTESVTFAVPDHAQYWGELNLDCYHALAAAGLATSSLAAKFAEQSPLFAPAMKQADLDIDRDVKAAGVFECGAEPCMYMAVTLRSPQRSVDAFRALAPDGSFQDLGAGHYTMLTSNDRGPWRLDFRVVPIRWRDRPPSDPLAATLAAATHVVFLRGRDPKAASGLVKPSRDVHELYKKACALGDRTACTRARSGERVAP